MAEKETSLLSVLDRYNLLEGAPDAMLIADHGGHIVLVNTQAEVLFGYARDELVGRQVECLLPERYRTTHLAHRAAYFAHRWRRPMGSADVPLFGARKNGTEFPAEISLSSFETPDGLMTIAAIRDTTERVRADEARANLRRAQESLRLRDEFLSIASHELKTPLSAVRMQTESILRLARKERDAVPERLLTRIETVHRAVHRLDALVNQLLDVSRLGAGALALKRVEVDLAAMVRSVAQLFEGELARVGSELVLRADAGVIGTWDSMRIEQVVTNLLSNAIKYGNRRPIEVSVTAPEPNTARLVVRDHGIGIAPAHHARIFERFERAVPEREYRGAGIGLWIAREIVEAHGGTIAVKSQLGAGASFTVDLPRRAEAARVRAMEAMGTEVPARPAVMLIEDNEMIREAFVDILSDEGISAVTAEDGLVALGMLRGGVRPNLIFLDLTMPVMDAWTFRAEQLKDPSLATIPIAVLSAADGLDARASTLGAVACVRKPPDLAELVALIARHSGA